MRGIAKKLLVLFGILSMGIGMVGTVVPILPTVPFLIVAAFCFAKGSERFHRWFIATKVYQDHLQSFVEHRSMTRKQKVRALGLMTVMILCAMYFVPLWQGRAGLLAVIIFNYIFFACGIKTISEEKAKKLKEEGGVNGK